MWRRRTQTLDAVVPAAVFGRYGIVQIEVASDGTGGRILEICERRLSTHTCLWRFSEPLTGVLGKRPFAEFIAKIRIR